MIKITSVSDITLCASLVFIVSTMLSFSFLSTSTAVANSSEWIDEIEIKIPATCTLAGTGANTHAAEINNGQYDSAIGETTLKAFCNDSEGFSIYAIGFTDNEYGKNVLTDHITGDTYDIPTGTLTSGSDSQWAMKLIAVTTPTPTYPISIENSFDSFHTVPTSYTLVATRQSGTDVGTSAEGSTLKTTYQAYIKDTQPAGSYQGQVKYTLVHPASEVPLQPHDTTAGFIGYYPNASSVADSMADQSITTSATSATLWPSNFKREGYGFAGWSDKFDWVLNENDANGNGTGANEGYHIYGPMQDITFTAGQYSGDNKGLSLYAVWVPSAGYIQNWTCPNDTTMPIGTVTALTDKRDDDTYAVAKLADSNCWMIENLRLDYDAEHNADGSLAQGYGASATYGNFSGLARPETANFSSTTSPTGSTEPNSLYYAGSNQGALGATINISQTQCAGCRMPRYRNDNVNTDATINPNTTTTNMTGLDENIYSYGNYYTWAAAIADTTYYGTNNQSVTTTSLCPAGWRLPKGGDKTRIEQPYDDNEFWNLIVDGLNGGTLPNNYNSSTTPYYTGADEAGSIDNLAKSFPNNLLYSGNAGAASVNNRGSTGRYWSSTVKDYRYLYYLSLYSSRVSPGTNLSGKESGGSIRCLVGT